MDTVKKYSLILNAALVVLVIFMYQCSGGKVKTVTLPGDTKFTTVHDTSFKERLVYQKTPGKTYTSHDTVYYHDTVVYNHYDSTKAAVACFQSRAFRDTTKASDVIIYRYDSLYMNNFVKHVIQVKNTRKTVQNITNPPKAQFFIGGMAGVDLSLTHIIVAPSIMYESKGYQTYSLSYDIVSKSPMLGVYFKMGH